MYVKALTPEHPALWREVRRTAGDVRVAFTEMPDEPYRGAKSICGLWRSHEAQKWTRCEDRRRELSS